MEGTGGRIMPTAAEGTFGINSKPRSGGISESHRRCRAWRRPPSSITVAGSVGLSLPPIVPLDPQLRVAWEAGLAGEEAEAESNTDTESNTEAQTCWSGPNGDIPTDCERTFTTKATTPAGPPSPTASMTPTGVTPTATGSSSASNAAAPRAVRQRPAVMNKHDYGREQGYIAEDADHVGLRR